MFRRRHRKRVACNRQEPKHITPRRIPPPCTPTKRRGIMNTLRAIQPSCPLPNASLAHRNKSRIRQRSASSFCSFNDGGPAADPSPPSEGDKRRQELLARIAMLQAHKVRLTDFLDERSAYLTQFAEDSYSEFDQIGENALKELDDASDRIMEKLENRAQAFEEAAEINRQEIERNDKVLEEFEDQIVKDRNEGLFFKNLREKKPAAKDRMAEARMEAQKLKEATKSTAGSKIRSNIYLALMAVLGITIINAVVATPEVEWRKVAALGLIFVGLVAQFIYEKSLSSETEDMEKKDE